MLTNKKDLNSVNSRECNKRLRSCALSNGFEEVSVEQDQDELYQLLSDMKNSDETAMSKFYDLTVNRVYGLALRIVGRPDLAEEVVCDVFLQVWNNCASFDGDRAKPIAWLMMICRSRALDKLRREQSATKNQFPEEEEQQAEDTSITTPFEDLSSIQASHTVYQAIKILNDKQRQIITLAFYKGMSQTEISEYLGEPLGTIKSNMRRAQLVLKNALSKDNFSLGDVYGKA